MLGKRQLEAMVLLEVQHAQEHRKGREDSFVELKRSFPEDRRKAARQIAAICNAARGEDVLWIVGIDDKTGEIHTPASTDIQDWWPGVAKCFDDVTPEMSHLVVSVDEGKAVVGLVFETDRAPYVVTTDGRGQAQCEVPWRDGATTRSAHRRELMRILAPTATVPALELLGVYVRGSYRPATRGGGISGQLPAPESFELSVSADLFVDLSKPVTFPRHRQRLVVYCDDEPFPTDVRFPEYKDQPAIEYGNHAVHVSSPTLMELRASGVYEEQVAEWVKLLWETRDVRVRLDLSVSGNERQVTLVETLVSRESKYEEFPASWESYSDIVTWSWQRPSGTLGQ